METMCERCERLDVQALKNRTNKLVLLVDKVARAVEIKEPDWEKRLEAVREWADNEIARQMMPKRKRREEEGNNA
ncbi:MAG: hypothetical protein A4E60_00195 [Syntrophorhabdus sp. PtaB.Bin047]|nr:MAG: hypothetical protein A4E60_00195 [Syntrophorhabdus sp. PtaB.Bin047]